jgi:hypothetical protein
VLTIAKAIEAANAAILKLVCLYIRRISPIRFDLTKKISLPS